MWTTFLVTSKTNLREKSALFWLFCFPIILSTMFMGIFGQLGQSYDLVTMKFAVVADNDYCASTSARALLNSMQQTPLQTCDTTDTADTVIDTDDTDLTHLLELTAVDTVNEATALVNRDTSVRGYFTVDDDGPLHMTVSRNTVSLANSPDTEPGLTISLGILNSALSMTNRQDLVLTHVLERNGTLMHDPEFLDRLQDPSPSAREITLTNFKPEETARYFYALLAMTALMAMTFAVATICTTQANLSALGMRRSMGPTSKWRQIAGGFLASWLCTFLSLLVALAYIAFVCKVSVGGRYMASILAIVVASFTATALGTLLGSLPKLSMGTKVGLTTAFACALSLFSGLYGAGAMELSDMIQRQAPWLAAMNPTQQIANLFYDILYYDSYMPFARTIAILLVMAAVSLGGATFFLRRQRYEHL